MTVSRERLSEVAALFASACVGTILLAGLVASPAGLLVLLAVLSFASLPAVVGAVLLALAGRRALRGARPVGPLLVSPLLLLPGACFATWIGVASLSPDEPLAPGTAFACGVALVLAPLGWALAVSAALLVVPRRVRWVPLITWGNVAVMVLSCATALGWMQPGRS